jgi:hypothetical protein
MHQGRPEARWKVGPGEVGGLRGRRTRVSDMNLNFPSSRKSIACRYLVALVEESRKRSSEFMEEEARLLLNDGAILLLQRECMGVRENDKDVVRSHRL